MRALRERGALLTRIAEQCAARDQPRSARTFERKAKDANEQAEVVLTALRRAAQNTLREVPDGGDVLDEQAS